MLESKLAINEQKVADKVLGLESQMQALLQRVNGKEKEVVLSSAIQVVDKTPLLPTPIHKQHDDAEGLWMDKNSRNPWVPHPKIELPMFNGDCLREWIRKCQKYFSVYQIPEAQRMNFVEINVYEG